MEHLIEIGLFSGKVLVIVLAIGAIILLIASLAVKAKAKEHLEIEDLNDKFQEFSQMLKSHFLGKKEIEDLRKQQKKVAKHRRKLGAKKRKVFVIEFDGDLKASAVQHMRQEITAVLSVADDGDEVIALVNSAGGMVHAYGLAAAQLLRIRNRGLKLTVCVDKVAASGGYLMACTAHQIMAAPFAIVGSIGVLAQVPNLHRLLKKNDIDYEEFTAGEFKRTVSLLGEITEKGKKKFVEQIEETHQHFKTFVAQQRPSLNVDQIATGEYWLGVQAKDLGLVDVITTSDEYIYSLKDEAQIYKVSMHAKRKLSEKLSEALSASGTKAAEKFTESLLNRPIL